jgi:NADH:ubiquinone oxidoreductase subunit D
MDVGALTPPLWGFEEREKLMVFYERASGSRMHAKYFRFGGVHQDLPPRLIEDIAKFCETHPKVLDDIENRSPTTASSSSATSTSASSTWRTACAGASRA